MMLSLTKIAAILLLVALLIVAVNVAIPDHAPGFSLSENDLPTQEAERETAAPTAFHEPIANAGARVTKKSFGTYVEPNRSPVSPERFRGYHTGVDYETFPDEQDRDIAVAAICSGPLLQRRTVSGYGGMLVQSCTLDGESVTVVYGHVRLTSVAAAVGDTVAAGTQLAVLGSGYSAETDGERKHLHLGIHRGTGVNIAGYVQTQAALSGWLDPATLLE